LTLDEFYTLCNSKRDASRGVSTLRSWSVSGMTDEMARDEARHGKAFAGLLARYFG
jgi:hypothetical protein